MNAEQVRAYVAQQYPNAMNSPLARTFEVMAEISEAEAERKVADAFVKLVQYVADGIADSNPDMDEDDIKGALEEHFYDDHMPKGTPADVFSFAASEAIAGASLDLPNYCGNCSGSGEGAFDGSTCSVCKGHGEIGSAA